jgi:hypothetical protein
MTMTEQEKRHYYYLKNKERRKLYVKEYYYEHKEEIRLYQHKYLSEHKEKLKEYKRNYRLANFEILNANKRMSRWFAKINKLFEEMNTLKHTFTEEEVKEYEDLLEQREKLIKERVALRDKYEKLRLRDANKINEKLKVIHARTKELRLKITTYALNKVRDEGMGFIRRQEQTKYQKEAKAKEYEKRLYEANMQKAKERKEAENERLKQDKILQQLHAKNEVKNQAYIDEINFYERMGLPLPQHLQEYKQTINNQ